MAVMGVKDYFEKYRNACVSIRQRLGACGAEPLARSCPAMTDSPPRRRIPYGELIAFAALVVSAFGVWIAWKGSNNDQPTRVVEQHQPIPLALRSRIKDDGRSLEISPVEGGHALQSLTITAGVTKFELGSDGELNARDVENALAKSADDREGTQRLRVRTEARYVEAGADKTATGSYMLTYRWEEGGLLGGRSLRLVGLSR
jgi:hypothetical protein